MDPEKRQVSKRRTYKAFLEPDYEARSRNRVTHQRWMRRLQNGSESASEDAGSQQYVDVRKVDELQSASTNAQVSLCSIEHRDDTTECSGLSNYASENQELRGNECLANNSDSQEENKDISESEDIVDMHDSYYNEDEELHDHDWLEEDFSLREDHTAENIPEYGDEIMFEVSALTVGEVFLMVQGVSLRFHLSDEARQAILELTKVLAGPRFHKLNTTKYTIAKKFDPPEDIISYVFYCEHCNRLLSGPNSKSSIPKGQLLVCEQCDKEHLISLDTSRYFLCIDVEYQIRSLLEDNNIRQSLRENIREIRTRQSTNTSDICDIHDGKLFRRIIESGTNEKDLVLTFNFNTDGAPLFHSSRKSFWPLQLIINELPPKIRFKSLILGALWVSKSEPKPGFMNLYMDIFNRQIKKLMSEGISVINSKGDTITFTIMPLCACVDSVARPIMQNRLQFNGYFGCSWCYAHGEYYKNAMRYPLTSEDPDLRTHSEYVKDVQDALELRKPIRGVKGECTLGKLPGFDSVWGYPYDYLHGGLLGPAKHMTEGFVTPGEPFYLTASVRQRVNSRLTSIQPPQEIHRLPRSLDERKQWKASEWRSWLLYYSIPCLKGILNAEALQSFSLFVKSMHTLLSDRITEDQLTQCELDLLQFVGECEVLYGKQAMTFNLHSLLHVVSNVRQSGPLWATSTFPFESGIYGLKQQVTGPKGVPDQIAKGALQTHAYNSRVARLHCTNMCSIFCQNLFTHRILTMHYQKTDSGALLIGEENVYPKDVEIFYRYNFSEVCNQQLPIKIYNRCIYKGTVFHSTLYTRPKKTNDTMIQLRSGIIVKICNFIYTENECYITVTELVTSPIGDGSKVEHIMQVTREKKTRQVVTMRSILQKVIYVDIEGGPYVCIPCNVSEIQ